MQRDSIGYIFTVAGIVCAVCALVVSAAAIGLKPQQEAWVQIDTQRNILFAAAADDEERAKFKKMSGEEVKDFFTKNFRDIVIDLATGEDVTEQYEGRLATYRQVEAAELRKAGQYTNIPVDLDFGQIKRRENHSHVYLRTDSTVRYVFPIRGKGLWSTLKGFLALQPDLKKAAYLTFYSHAETPGLGGEVDNAGWKSRWNGKVLFDDDGNVKLTVVKGDSKTDSEVDGLSGATITSKGVENMMKYWMGDQGFGPYLRRVRQEKP